MKSTVRQRICRWIIYIVGMVVLSFGIILNTKSGLGVSPIISVSYSISEIWHLNFGNTTFLLYTAFVLIEIALHLRAHREKAAFVLDLLQLPISLVVTRIMNVFSAWLPDFAADYAGTFWGQIPGRILVLLAAIVFTGIGIAMSLNMRIVPNPGDGVVQAIADTIGKDVGFTKNLFDFLCILTTCVVCLLTVHRIIGIGLGTVIAMLGIGRAVFVCNYFTRDLLLKAAGMPMHSR